MKKIMFLLFTILFLIITGILSLDFSVPVMDISETVFGEIPVPLIELFMGLLYVLISHKIFHFKFGYTFKNFSLKSPWLIFPVVISVLINILTYRSIDIILNKLLMAQIVLYIFASLVGAFIVGFFEETIIRGGIFNFLMSCLKNNKFKVLWSTLISSFIFGLVHLNNYFWGADLEDTLYQIVYAAAIGFVFSMAYVRTRNLLVPIVMHTLIDWSAFLFDFADEPVLNGIQWSSILFTIVCVVCGIIMYIKLPKVDDWFDLSI